MPRVITQASINHTLQQSRTAQESMPE